MISKKDISEWFKSLQDRICTGLEQSDGFAKFDEDKWIREGGGGGITRVINNGNVFEKGGVNFSAVYGESPSFLKDEVKSNQPSEFYATGVSIVIHPHSPMVPIIHMNVRYLEIHIGNEILNSWFGGGIDLTPIYIDKKQARFFHQQLKDTCDKHDKDYYSKFKLWSDDYFFIRHRKETRGIGGIFFDRLTAEDGSSQSKIFDFVKAVGETFLPTYRKIVDENRIKSFGEQQKQWQLIRRGRYAEFNLIYDRGTKFGLDTEGRSESILMSLPPLASWIYNFNPVAGSAEEQTQKNLVKGIDWLI